MTLVEVEFRGAGKEFRTGGWYVLVSGELGRTLSVRCIDVDQDRVTFELPAVAQA